MMRGEAKPVMRLKRLPMLGPNLGMSTWAYNPEDEKRLPLASIMKKVAALEQEPGMLDITVFVGFAWSDIPECVTSILAISDNKPALAEKMADMVASMVWDARWDFIKLRPLVPADEAVDRAVKASEGPIVLVDVADNSGGGGPCDNTVILEALLRKGAEDAVVPLRDTDAVSKAFKAGVGSVIKLEV
jgi:microcystin degradation protein MlrC